MLNLSRASRLVLETSSASANSGMPSVNTNFTTTRTDTGFNPVPAPIIRTDANSARATTFTCEEGLHFFDAPEDFSCIEVGRSDPPPNNDGGDGEQGDDAFFNAVDEFVPPFLQEGEPGNDDDDDRSFSLSPGYMAENGDDLGSDPGDFDASLFHDRDYLAGVASGAFNRENFFDDDEDEDDSVAPSVPAITSSRRDGRPVARPVSRVRVASSTNNASGTSQNTEISSVGPSCSLANPPQVEVNPVRAAVSNETSVAAVVFTAPPTIAMVTEPFIVDIADITAPPPTAATVTLPVIAAVSDINEPAIIVPAGNVAVSDVIAPAGNVAAISDIIVPAGIVADPIGTLDVAVDPIPAAIIVPVVSAPTPVIEEDEIMAFAGPITAPTTADNTCLSEDPMDIDGPEFSDHHVHWDPMEVDMFKPSMAREMARLLDLVHRDGVSRGRSLPVLARCSSRVTSARSSARFEVRSASLGVRVGGGVRPVPLRTTVGRRGRMALKAARK